jgi:hypothetical protein
MGTSLRSLGFPASPVLAQTKNKKPCYRLDSRVSICHKAKLAPRPGLEPGTYGLTVPIRIYAIVLINVE